MQELLLHAPLALANRQKNTMGHDPKFALRVQRAPLVVPNSTGAVVAALARPSACVPDGAVVLSMANKHHSKLRKLQFERVRHLECFMARVISVCWGDWPDDLGVCVRGSCNGGVGSACLPSDYRRSQYVSLNWAKWPFFINVLQAGL